MLKRHESPNGGEGVGSRGRGEGDSKRGVREMRLREG